MKIRFSIAALSLLANILHTNVAFSNVHSKKSLMEKIKSATPAQYGAAAALLATTLYVGSKAAKAFSPKKSVLVTHRYKPISLVARTAGRMFKSFIPTRNELKKIIDPKDFIFDSAMKKRFSKMKKDYKHALNDNTALFPWYFFKGIPGTGKRLTAQRIARDIGVASITISADKMYMWHEEERMKNLFTEMVKVVREAESQRRCIIIVDNADKLPILNRTKSTSGLSDKDHEYLNAFITLMLSTTSKEKNIAFIFLFDEGTGYLKWDRAIHTRVGQTIQFNLPGMNQREQIIKLFMGKSSLTYDVNVSLEAQLHAREIAHRTQGFTPRSLRRLVQDMFRDVKIAGKFRLTSDDMNKSWQKHKENYQRH